MAVCFPPAPDGMGARSRPAAASRALDPGQSSGASDLFVARETGEAMRAAFEEEELNLTREGTA